MSKKYERGDIATYYFIIKKKNGEKAIQAWTDNKELAKLYVDFHHCSMFSIKKHTALIEEIVDILNENTHDEVKIAYINIRDPKNPHKIKSMAIPATDTEIAMINEECNTYLASFIDYSYMNQAIPYLKKKYIEALRDIFLIDVMNKVIHERRSVFTDTVSLDQLMILYTCYEENFG